MYLESIVIRRHRHLTWLSIFYYILLLAAILAPSSAPAAPILTQMDAPSVEPLDSAPFGLNTHLATRYPDLHSMDKPAALVAQVGAGWAREDIHWWRIQPTPDTWDWSFTDQAMRVLLDRKIKIVGVLGHPPGWATPFSGDAPQDVSFYAPDPAQFVKFAKTVVNRYQRYVEYWEIWNEPDNPLFWKPSPDPLAYAALLKQTSIAIHTVAPQTKILIGGLNPFDTEFLRRVAEAGAWSSFDILAIHPYVAPATPEAGNIGAVTDGVRILMKQYGDKPIWATEIGWSSGPSDRDSRGLVDGQAEANYLVRATILLWQAGVSRIFWYTLKDDPDNPYGLVAYGSGQTDYSILKPAFYAFRTLSQQLRNTSFIGIRDLFTRTTRFDFEILGTWHRGDQPYGELHSTPTLSHSGQASAELDYSFPTAGNDYVVFVRDQPIPIPDVPYALGIWVYGDGSGNKLKIWLQDAEGEILQFSLGTVGPIGWHFLQAPIGSSVPAWDRISTNGNGQLDFPISLYALVVDDAPDAFIGNGVIYLDDLTAISGPEAYDVQLQRENMALDVLWAPEGVRARLPSSAPSADIVDRDGNRRTIAINDGTILLDLGPSPIYVQHTR